MAEITMHRFDLPMLDECVDLYQKTYALPPWNESWESRAVVENFYKNHFANNYFCGHAALLEGRIVAVSAGFLKPYIQGMELYIDDFFVDADHQRQGIGRAFMAGIREDLLSRDIHAIMLNTERVFPAYAFYQNLGFEPDENTVILYNSF